MDESALEFEGPAFTDATIRSIPNLDKVKMLNLWGTGVTDVGCRELARAGALVEIAISSDLVTDTVLHVLADLPSLRSLQIHRGPRIGDDGARSLSKCANLRELYLIETAVTDMGLTAIRKLPNVWNLLLDDTIVSDVGCAALAELPQLSLLSLNRTRVAGFSLASLRDNKHLNVYLDGAPVADEAMEAAAARLSNLKLISLNQTNVGDRAARALAKLKRLNDVRLSDTQLTDDGLAAFHGHPYLDAIYVEGCAVSRRAVKALIKSSKRELDVYGPEREA